MLKNFTSLFILSALIGGAFSASAAHDKVARQKVNSIKCAKGDVIVHNGRSFQVGLPGAVSRHKVKRASVPVGDVIDNPSGKAREYSKASGGYYYYGNVSPYMDYGQAATIFWDGDEAYIYNILSYKESYSYIYGEHKGNTLVVPLNQTVAVEPDFGVNVGLLKTVLVEAPNPNWEEDDDPDSKNIIYIDFEYNEDYADVTYTIDDYGTLELVIPEAKDPNYGTTEDGYQLIDPAEYGFPAYALGYYYTDDLSWSGDCDIYQSYEEFNYELVVEPAGLDYKYFSYVNSYDMGVLVNVARDGDTLYMKGLSAYAPDAVFKAEIKRTDEGLIASVPQYQYIGRTEDGYYNLLTRTLVYDSGERDYVLAPADVDATFFLTEDAETGTIQAIWADRAVNTLVFNYADDYYDPYDEFPNIYLNYQESLAGTPLPPGQPYFEDHSFALGAYYLFFFFSQFSEEGTILDVDRLYYRIFIDGEPYVFEQHTGENLKGDFTTMYAGVTTPTTLIPYTLYNGLDLFSDEYHLFYVGFYQTGIETIGIQTVYTYGDEPTYSEIVTIDVSGVKEVPADAVAAEYYNLNGLKVDNPDKGIYIVRYKMTDGSTKVAKIVK